MKYGHPDSPRSVAVRPTAVPASSGSELTRSLSFERHPVTGRGIQWRDWGGSKSIKVLPPHQLSLHRKCSDRTQSGISFVIASPMNLCVFVSLW
jgi:hypothetical protein